MKSKDKAIILVSKTIHKRLKKVFFYKLINKIKFFNTKKNSLRTGFEPVRENPNRFQVCRLNHSAIAACYKIYL